MAEEQAAQQKQNQLSERRTLWKQKSREVARLTDKLGKGIDAGIRDTVIGLQLLGFNTTGSCEGHLNRGVCAPWVDIATPLSSELEQLEAQKQHAFQEAERLEENNGPEEDVTQMYARAHALRRQAQGMYVHGAWKLVPYLEAFYAHRQTPFDRRLTLSFFGHGRWRMQSQGAAFQEAFPEAMRKKKLAEYQEEMTEFTAFLEETFLSGIIY